jgi:hypothetical protein
MKTIALLCAALAVMAAGGFSMHKAGWFKAQRAPRAEASRQAKAEDPMHSEAAMRYRTNNQGTSWRLAMTVR